MIQWIMALAHFEWDSDKDAENQRKHGVSFGRAQYAFGDPQRILARDISHSRTEERFYCFGWVDGGILTVRFTYRAPATGAREGRSMSTRTRYTDEPLGTVEIVPDFLPSPAELAFREEGVKITLALSRKSIDYFKSEAARHHTQYQRMIRRLLDAYVDAQIKADTSPRIDPAGHPATRRAARR